MIVYGMFPVKRPDTSCATQFIHNQQSQSGYFTHCRYKWRQVWEPHIYYSIVRHPNNAAANNAAANYAAANNTAANYAADNNAADNNAAANYDPHHST